MTAERISTAQLYQALKDFRNEYDKDQVNYKDGVTQHREEHTAVNTAITDINKLLKGDNGNPGYGEQIRDNREKICALEKKEQETIKTRRWLIGISIPTVLTMIGMALKILGYL